MCQVAKPKMPSSDVTLTCPFAAVPAYFPGSPSIWRMSGMRKSRCAGMPVKELCRKGGFSDATIYKWRGKYGVTIKNQFHAC